MIRALHYTEAGGARVGLAPSEFAPALQDDAGFLWVDFRAEPPEGCAPILRETFGFHPLAVADALEEKHVPKIDDWDHYLYLVLHSVVFDRQSGEQLYTLELDIFVGKNYLVTYQTQPVLVVDRVWNAFVRGDPHHRRGTSQLLYRLIDELVADYLPVMEDLDEVLDQLEDQIFSNPHPVLLERIFATKRALLHLRRIIAPQREVLNKLARGDYAVIDHEERVFFRDVYDHLVRLYDITESSRDLVGSAVDTYLSVVNNRMNDVMKTLTIITTLFMPLTFLTGFFGMNYFQPVARLDVWTDKPAFILIVIAMLLIPVGMYRWMRRRAWM